LNLHRRKGLKFRASHIQDRSLLHSTGWLPSGICNHWFQWRFFLAVAMIIFLQKI